MSNKEAYFEHKVPDLLPAPISKIEVQKKRAYRYSLFVQDTFIIGVSEYTLTSLNLSKGLSLTHSLLDKIKESENYYFARDYFMRLLGRRSHSKAELQRKGIKKGYPKAQAQHILNELEEKGYLNDRDFAFAFTRDKLKTGKWGAHKICGALAQKGVSKPIIKECRSFIEKKQDVTQLLFETIKKNIRKFQRVQDIPKRKVKMYSFLTQRGIPSQYISKHIDELIKLTQY